MWHVEWRVARSWDLPFDRIEQARNYTNAETAARQVAAIRRVEATHAELVGVWVTVGGSEDRLDWRPIDPDSLPLSSQDAAEDALRRIGMASHPDAKVQALIGESNEREP